MKTNRLTDIEKKLSALPEAPSLFDDLSEKDRNFNRAMVEIALAIKNERIFRGLTQKEFADFLEVKQTQVSRWESGDERVTASTNETSKGISRRLSIKALSGGRWSR